MKDDILLKLNRLGVTKGFDPNWQINLKSSSDPFENLRQAFPDGIIEENEFGKVFNNRIIIPLPYDQGTISIGNDLVESQLFRYLIDQGNLQKEDTLAMDTETSGLSSGVGEFIFMIGMGYFQENRYIVDQLILADLAYEKPFINQIEKTFTRFPVLLTYNGKSFDVPMIQNRANFNFFPDFCHDIKHIDLLLLCRKLWKKSLGSVRLSNIEKEVLRLDRGDQEIPGSEAPEIYRRFLLGSKPDDLRGIAYHNQNDVVSLIAILQLINKISAADSNQLLNEFGVDIDTYQKLKSQLIIENFDFSSGNYPDYSEFSEKELSHFLKILKNNGDYQKIAEILSDQGIKGNIDSCWKAAKIYQSKLHNNTKALDILNTGLFILQSDADVPLWTRKAKSEQFENAIGKLEKKSY